MAKNNGSKPVLIIVLILALVLAGAAYIFRDKLTNPIRGGGKAKKKYPSLVNGGSRAQGVRDRNSKR